MSSESTPQQERFDDSVFRSVFEAEPDAVLLVDTAGRIVLANRACSNLLGYSHQELLARSVDDLVPEASAARHAGLREGFSRAPRTRPMGNELELNARRADGSEVMIEIALSPLRYGDQMLVLASIRGIGDYPRVQRAMRRSRFNETVAQVARLAVDARDPQELISCVAAFSAQALEVEEMTVWLLEPNRLEFRAASIYLAGAGPLKHPSLPNRPDTLPGFVALHREPLIVSNFARENRFKVAPALREGRASCALAVPMIDDRRVIGVLVASSVKPGRFADDERNFVSSLANLVVTSLQRAHTEAQLAHAQRMEAVGQLTGGIAHDFNNLLTIIQGNLQMLTDLPEVTGNPLLAQLAGAAAHASKRGAELTGKLLAFARRQSLDSAAVDVGALLRSVADMLRRTIGDGIFLQVHGASSCPPCLADAGQLESALLNIAINARDAMPDGGTLSFACAACSSPPAEMRASPGAEGCVAITIRDTGVGMSAEVLDRAFEPFFTTKAAGKGTGLGLSTVYGFVKQSGGHLQVESRAGAGTTITLYLPGVSVDKPRVARPQFAAAELPRGTRVLMVEDDAAVSRVGVAFLEALGCEVAAVEGAETALAELQRGTPFDLLFTDITLGAGINGIDLAHQAHAARPQLPVLLTSGYSRYLNAESPDRPGQWPVLGKPYSREQLAVAAAAALTAGRALPETPPPG